MTAPECCPECRASDAEARAEAAEATLAAIRDMCEKRIKAVSKFLTPADINAHDVLALIDGREPSES